MLLPGYSVLISSSLLTALLVSASLVTALLITALLCPVTLIYCAISYYRALEVKPSSLSIHDSITNTKFHAEIWDIFVLILFATRRNQICTPQVQ